jgi:hypothetical protein
MIRRSQISISESNQGKLNTLDDLLLESQRVINLYIDEIWRKKDFTSKYVDFKVDTWLSSRMQQNLGKQALSIVKSQKEKKKPHKPIFKKFSFDLDSRFVDVQFDNNSFDIWVRLQSIGNKINLKLPGKKQFNNKLQRWSYRKVFDMLSLRCEELGIFFKEINPAYTSQTCSSCGFKHKNNRLVEKFLCLDCGNALDADYNASLNILALGSL